MLCVPVGDLNEFDIVDADESDWPETSLALWIVERSCRWTIDIAALTSEGQALAMLVLILHARSREMMSMGPKDARDLMKDVNNRSVNKISQQKIIWSDNIYWSYEENSSW